MPVHRHPIAVPRGSTRENLRLEFLPLDQALVTRLRSTYQQLHTADRQLAEVFYTKLFAAAPHLRSMFRDDPQSQARKLTAALDAVVDNLEHPARNAELLADLGRRHATYGVRPEHYTLVTALLIESMSDVLGPGASPAALDDWRLALRLIASQMLAATGHVEQSRA